MMKSFLRIMKFMENDEAFIRRYSFFCSFLGAFPWSVKEKSCRSIFLNFYSFLLLVLFLTGGVLTFMEKIQFIYKYTTFTASIADFIVFFFELISILIILCGNMRGDDEWKKGFDKLTEVKNQMSLQGLFIEYHVFSPTIKIAGIYLIYLIRNVYICYVYSLIWEKVLYSNILHIVMHCYHILVFGFLNELTNILKRRYNCLDTAILQTFSKYTRVTEDTAAQNNIKHVKITYKILNGTTQKVNDKLGSYIFFLTGSALLNLLSSFSWLIDDIQENRFSRDLLPQMVVCSIVDSGYYVVSKSCTTLLVITNCCLK